MSVGLRAVRRQDIAGAALGEAFNAHYEALVRVGWLLSARKDMAEELAQEALARSARRLPSLSPQEVWPYLRQTEVNVWRNMLRRRALERRVQAEEPMSVPDAQAAVVARDEVWRALQRLSTRQRACLVLRYYEDLSENDIASVLGCSTGAVKRHVFRGLERLRRELEPR